VGVGDDMPPPLFALKEDALTSKERQLYDLLGREYNPDLARDVLLPLIQQTGPVSLRVLDWAVVNWAKTHKVMATSTSGRPTNVYQSYRTTLGYWRRRLFDPFRRRRRIGLHLDGVLYETTLGQANYILWLYRTGTLAYVLGHAEEIESHMNSVTQAQRRERRHARANGVACKRTSLTPDGGSTCVALQTSTLFRLE
jgi:hypothetical protein